ncbi:hypothetical protein LTR05_002579 [Lithohypha guttulata]|uniref:DJ-1/PfpI domain-containing protein n=1 Tax=Lithohypha guttulata TaxID=1690604 RepID=A0AAN7T2G9_9EURO|nr:hypothetical protein LTR05_002579 [Lithohypha guttulata]
MPFTTPPKNYFLILFPGYQLLDAAGPLDIIETITKHPPINGLDTDVTLTVLAETLSAPPTAPIPPRGASYTFDLSGPEMQTFLRTDGSGGVSGARCNPRFAVDLTFEQALEGLRRDGSVEVEVPSADGSGEWVVEKRGVDVLLVPGGVGTRMERVERGSGERMLNVKPSVSFVEEVCRGGWVRDAVLTVCTGSDLFARTGLLNGRRATTNWNAFDKVAGRHSGVKWLKGRRWVRSKPQEIEGQDGNEKGGFEKEIWTSAGISAGMDLMLWFVAEVYGYDFAKSLARKLEYEWRDNVGDGETDPFYTREGSKH